MEEEEKTEKKRDDKEKRQNREDREEELLEEVITPMREEKKRMSLVLPFLVLVFSLLILILLSVRRFLTPLLLLLGIVFGVFGVVFYHLLLKLEESKKREREREKEGKRREKEGKKREKELQKDYMDRFKEDRKERKIVNEKVDKIFSKSFVGELKKLFGERKEKGKRIKNRLVDELFIGYFNLLGFSLPDDETIEVIDMIFKNDITVIRQMSGTGKTHLCRKIHFLNNLRFYLEDPKTKNLLNQVSKEEITKVPNILKKELFVESVKKTLVSYSICCKVGRNGTSRFLSEVDFGFSRFLSEIEAFTRGVIKNKMKGVPVKYSENNLLVFHILSKYLLSILLFYHIVKKEYKVIDSRKMINGNTKLIETAFKEIEKIDEKHSVDILNVLTIMEEKFPCTKNFVFIFDEAQVLMEKLVAHVFASFQHDGRSVIAPFVLYNQVLNQSLQGNGKTVEFVFSGTNVTSELDLMISSSLFKVEDPNFDNKLNVVNLGKNVKDGELFKLWKVKDIVELMGKFDIDTKIIDKYRDKLYVLEGYKPRIPVRFIGNYLNDKHTKKASQKSPFINALNKTVDECVKEMVENFRTKLKLKKTGNREFRDFLVNALDIFLFKYDMRRDTVGSSTSKEPESPKSEDEEVGFYQWKELTLPIANLDKLEVKYLELGFGMFQRTKNDGEVRFFREFISLLAVLIYFFNRKDREKEDQESIFKNQLFKYRSSSVEGGYTFEKVVFADLCREESIYFRIFKDKMREEGIKIEKNWKFFGKEMFYNVYNAINNSRQEDWRGREILSKLNNSSNKSGIGLFDHSMKVSEGKYNEEVIVDSNHWKSESFGFIKKEAKARKGVTICPFFVCCKNTKNFQDDNINVVVEHLKDLKLERFQLDARVCDCIFILGVQSAHGKDDKFRVTSYKCRDRRIKSEIPVYILETGLKFYA